MKYFHKVLTVIAIVSVIGNLVFTACFFQKAGLELNTQDKSTFVASEDACTFSKVNQSHNNLFMGEALPPAAIFLRGNPAEPRFLWTYSFPRLLRNSLEKETRVFTSTARREKFYEVINFLPNISKQKKKTRELSLSEYAPEKDLRYIDEETALHILPTLKIVFTRALPIDQIIRLYPSLFKFCYSVAETNITNMCTSTCPVFVHFPIGSDHCKTCSSRWYKVVPDNTHVKAVPDDVWRRSFEIHQGLRPPNLLPEQWVAFQSKKCTLSYVSHWGNELKGQLPLAKELYRYKQHGSFPIGNFKICFAGKNSNTTYKEETLQVLNDAEIQYYDFGLLKSVVEQVALFALSGKSILLTAEDFAPRVVYLSLASGARVLTTPQAQIARPLIDNQCLVTEWDFFNAKTAPVKDRATFFWNFLERKNCDGDRNISRALTSKTHRSSETNATTLALAYDILQEHKQYVPLIHQALKLWQNLNFQEEGNTNTCADFFAAECSLYNKSRLK